MFFDDFDPELHGVDFNEEAMIIASSHIEELRDSTNIRENNENYISMNKSANYRKIVCSIFGIFEYKILLDDMLKFFEKLEEYEKCSKLICWIEESKEFEILLEKDSK